MLSRGRLPPPLNRIVLLSWFFPFSSFDSTSTLLFVLEWIRMRKYAACVARQPFVHTQTSRARWLGSGRQLPAASESLWAKHISHSLQPEKECLCRRFCE